MARHTFIARIKAFLQRLFRKPVRAHKVPLPILDGVCCELGSTDREVQDYLRHLVLKGEYKHPRPIEGYLCDEEGIDLLEFNTRKEKEMEERKREIKFTRGIRPPCGWGYGSDGEAFRAKRPEAISG